MDSDLSPCPSIRLFVPGPFARKSTPGWRGKVSWHFYEIIGFIIRSFLASSGRAQDAEFAGEGEGMWREGCGVWGVGCGMWDVGCGMWDVGCGMLGAGFSQYFSGCFFVCCMGYMRPLYRGKWS